MYETIKTLEHDNHSEFPNAKYLVEGLCPECGCNRLFEYTFYGEYSISCPACDETIASSL